MKLFKLDASQKLALEIYVVDPLKEYEFPGVLKHMTLFVEDLLKAKELVTSAVPAAEIDGAAELSDALHRLSLRLG